MKIIGKVMVLVVASLLVLSAYDSFVIHPAGRWQMAMGSQGLLKMDTTTGEVWQYYWSEPGKWIRLDGSTPKK